MNWKENCNEVIEWLREDQFSYGEWGKHELVQNEVRTFEDSKIKPNVFSSVYALNVLKVIGYDAKQEENAFREWLQSLRDEKGFFLGRAAKQTPYGHRYSYDSFINLRHTMKGLDYLLHEKLYSFEDIEIFHELLTYQNKDGSFPQIIKGNPDIWATAYFVNLMNTVLSKECLKQFVPRNKTLDSIQTEFMRRRDRALTWLIDWINSNTSIDDNREKNHTILALMVQIGPAVLGIREKDAEEILHRVFNMEIEEKYTKLFVLSMGFPVLNALEQKYLISEIQMLPSFQEVSQIDLVEVGSFGYLNYFGMDMGKLQYYNELNNMHEMGYPLRNVGRSHYLNWCIEKYHQLSKGQNIDRKQHPADKSDIWFFVYDLIMRYKKIVENERGWENLWENNKKIPVKEKQIQNHFWSSITMYLESQKIKYERETETGRGPVDFSFENGVSTKVFVEFKLASNSAIRRNFIEQIKSYMKNGACDSSYLVVVGFSKEDSSVLEGVNESIERSLKINPEFFIQCVYIDASIKISASKLQAVNDI